MGTTAGPRIDDRLRRFIDGSPEHAAEVTRRVGALAWELGLARPSYQQVRVLLNAARRGSPARRDLGRAPRRAVAPPRASRVRRVVGRAATPRPGPVADRLLSAAGLLPRSARITDIPARSRRLVLPRTRHDVLELIDHLWEYPGPGLSGFYERYKHGRL